MPVLPKLNLAIGKASEAGRFQFEDTNQQNEQQQQPHTSAAERSVSSPPNNIGIMTSNEMNEDYDAFEMEPDHYHHQSGHDDHIDMSDMLLGGEDDEHEDIGGHLLKVENSSTSVDYPLITLSHDDEVDQQSEIDGSSDLANEIKGEAIGSGEVTPEFQWSRPPTPTRLDELDSARRATPTPSTSAAGSKRTRRLPRTITKLAKDADPEKMPLRERLFYNPPETIYQKENKVNFLLERRGSTAGGSVKNETTMGGESATPRGLRRSSSRANSIDSRSSSKSGGSSKRGRMIIESDDEEEEDVANNNNNTVATKRASSIKDEDSNSIMTLGGEDDEASSKSGVELVIDEVTGQVVINNPEALAEQARNEAAAANGGGLRRVVSEQRTTYSSFRRRRERSKNMWNAEETATFYAALERIGTDFSLMEAIFFKDSTRDRRQLKQKFKREEKINRELIDGILYKQLGK